MYPQQAVQALPVELLSTVFDSLSIRDIVTASLVSTLWRAVARRNRTFWRDVGLTALSTSALDLFLARLYSGSSLSVHVDISISEAAETEFPERLRSIVFPAISHNLHRIDKLYLRIGICFDFDLFQALELPAPRLDTLDIVLCDDTQSSDALPANLFACHAPKLRYVRILNIRLFEDRIPRAFTGVTEFRYCFNQAQSFPIALFQHCKRLESLTIYGRHCAISHHSLETASLDDWNLKFIELSMYTGSFDLLHNIPCASVADITIPVIDELAAPFLLAHLRGRLELRLSHTPRDIDIRFTSRVTGMRRTFVCGPRQADTPYLPPAFVAHNLVSRIDTISCTSSSAPLLSAYDEMQSCTRLAVSVAEDEPLRPLTRVVSMPALECLEISSAVALRVRPADLLSFLVSAVLPVSRAVRVDLVGVELDGETSELGGCFVLPKIDVTVKDVSLTHPCSLLPPVAA